MRFSLILSVLVFGSHFGFCQTNSQVDKNTNKGKTYFYWGWNRDGYTKSNINFTGDNYDFTLNKVIAKDRQSRFSLKTYLNPTKITIPQYNFRIGHYFKENWDVSFGIDHMKYVVEQNQVTTISGYINDSQTKYNGTYLDDEITIAEDFLTFEHSDGLNYVNFELRHSDKLIEIGKFKLNLQEGVGIGFMLPKTNTTLYNRRRYDEFHLSGYGISTVVGLRASFFNIFFIQTELKGGFIDLPDVRTTLSKADRAQHNFFFSQLNVVFGGIINF